MTPQIMQNAMIERDVTSLSLFTLLIFDECHHTNKNHPYNGIMGHYIDEKFQAEKTAASAKAELPQVVSPIIHSEYLTHIFMWSLMIFC